MPSVLTFSLAAASLFVGMLVLLEAGRRLGLRDLARYPEGARAGFGTVDGAVFGLLALLLAFTFSGANARFETRRQLVVEEANAIGTAYLRIDLLPAAAQPALRDTFRRYLDTRLAVYQSLPDMQAAMAALDRANALQGEIWRMALAAARGPDARPDAPMLLVPALNQMFDITTTRSTAALTHPPSIIYVMLFALALASALLAGYGMAAAGRNWLHMLAFALAMGAALYVILDLEYPRQGLIKLDTFDQVLIDLRATMK